MIDHCTVSWRVPGPFVPFLLCPQVKSQVAPIPYSVFFYRKITSFSNFPLWPHAHNNVRKAWESVSGLQKDLLSYRRCWGACHPDLCCLWHRIYISVGSLCPLYRRAQYQHLQDRGQCTFHVIVRHFQTLCSKCWAQFSIASKHTWWHTYMTQND